ncbi:MAG TPA: CDP-alcohol phosphatidyltransferase family protein [Polyangiaceae bacterium]|nr:CDP-alcohol phosphatidyltransferase family protein [Polyangiaceae bacterium]
MSFWSGYWASLKPREVEETIDVYVHRPLAYLVARALYPLPISPDAVTGLSILAGIASAVSLLVTFPYHLQAGGLLLFISAVLDCADGQLARMRGTSSLFGRMLDGTADLITVGAVAPASLWVMWCQLTTPLWVKGTVVGVTCVAVVTTSFHTTMYDHYKNVFLRLTGPYQEGEDYESARERRESTRGKTSLVANLAYPIYLFYLKSQRDYVKVFDPYTSARLTEFPPYDPERGELYRTMAGPVMKLWRRYFGFGMMVFSLALFDALEHPEYFVVMRMFVLNPIFYLYLRPTQRRVSREAFRQMNLVLPDQAGASGLAVA